MSLGSKLNHPGGWKMELTDDLIESLPSEGTYDNQESVLIHLSFPVGKLNNKRALDAVFKLDELLREVIQKTGTGIFDGNEFCDALDEESVTFFVYGPDANIIFDIIEPILDSIVCYSGSYILKRFNKTKNMLEEKIIL